MSNVSSRAPIGASFVLALVLSSAAVAHAEPQAPPATSAAVPTPDPSAPAPVPPVHPETPPIVAAPPAAPPSSGRVLKVPVGDKTVDVALGCEGRAILKVGSRAYIACGEDGIVIVELEGEAGPRVGARIPTSGDAVGLFVRNGRVWVELAKIEAMPVGAARGVSDTPSGPVMAGSSAAGANPEPIQDAAARPPSGSVPSLVAPKRVGDLFELGLGSRLFLTVDDLGFGMLSHAFAVRRFEAPVAIRVDALPLAFATGKSGGAGAITVTAMVSIDTHVFELGAGVGGGTLPRSLRYSSSGTGDFVAVPGSSSSVVVPTLVRFGARDGLHIVGRTSLMVQSERFQLGAIDIVGQVPVTDRVALLFTGEGGNLGTASGGMAMRYRATETRGAGAVYVNGGAGYAYLQGSTTCVEQAGYPSCRRPEYHGPALSVGVELRL